jgi:hypothetical protein
MSVIGGQNPIVQDGLVYILDFGNERSYTSGSNTAQSLIYNPVTASFVAPPAGDYSGLAAAYSVRRVVSSYSGPAMEVQSGSVSASIGFDSLGNLDTASLEAFAGSGDAFVKTWYDQSGNGRHASQAVTSSQPQVVSSGTIYQLNNKPTIIAQPTQNWSFSPSISTELYSLFTTYYKTATGNQAIIGSGGSNYMWLDYELSQYFVNGRFITISSPFNINTQYTYNAIADALTGAEIWRNNNALGTAPSFSGAQNFINEFPYNIARTADLHLQEMLFNLFFKSIY